MARATESAFGDGTRISTGVPQIDVDYLKRHYTHIHYFGLGFIQIKLGEYDRVHVYHPELEAFVERPHDHRYDFESYVLAGTFTQRLYSFIACSHEETEYRMGEVSCEAGNDASPERHPVRLIEMREMCTRAGDSYRIGMDQFHTVHPEGKCATYLRRSKVYKEYARVVYRAGEEEVCPFSRPISEVKLWEYVHDVL